MVSYVNPMPSVFPLSLQVKSEVRRMKGIPALVSMLDNPKKEVHYAACGALKNISYGRDPDNKIAIKNCDGIPALVRLLRKTRDQDLTDSITGTHCFYAIKVTMKPTYGVCTGCERRGVVRQIL